MAPKIRRLKRFTALRLPKDEQLGAVARQALWRLVGIKVPGPSRAEYPPGHRGDSWGLGPVVDAIERV